MASIATQHGLSVENVEREIDEFAARLSGREVLDFGPGTAVDFTDQHLGVGYSVNLLCAQTAPDRDGRVALLRHSDSVDPRSEKVTISGHVTPGMVRHFMDVYVPAKSLHRVYGVPERGYAGGYLHS